MWRRPDMRSALAARDIATVFRLLQRVGVSQRRIAALTGQSQSEISEILSGRQVVSYDVLARIADGLEVPRGHLGLAYDDSTAQLLGVASGEEEPAPPADDEDPRRTLSRLAQLTLGAGDIDPSTFAQPFAVAWAAAPDHVGHTDVERLCAVTAALRALDYQYGGGAVRDAVLAQLAWAQQLVRSLVAEDAVHGLHVAVADLHNLAGWTSFDIGRTGPARRHFDRAIEHATHVAEKSLVAKALYCQGRVHLHHGWSIQAVKLMQLGQVSAEESGHVRTIAMMHANLAWAHAAAGDTKPALAAAARARDIYAHADEQEAPPWVRFFDAAELQALRAMTLATLPEPTAQQRAEAIERFSLSTVMRDVGLARSRAFEFTALSIVLLAEGELAEAVRVGHQAADLAVEIRSKRVVDRMAPLRSALQRHLANDDARDLLERLKTMPGV
jgi:transcriptional regulator with XRE-family HTH domain